MKGFFLSTLLLSAQINTPTLLYIQFNIPFWELRSALITLHKMTDFASLNWKLAKPESFYNFLYVSVRFRAYH